MRGLLPRLRKVEGRALTKPFAGTCVIGVGSGDFGVMKTQAYLLVIFIKAGKPTAILPRNTLIGATNAATLCSILVVLPRGHAAQIGAPIVERVAIDVVNDLARLRLHYKLSQPTAAPCPLVLRVNKGCAFCLVKPDIFTIDQVAIPLLNDELQTTTPDTDTDEARLIGDLVREIMDRQGFLRPALPVRPQGGDLNKNGGSDFQAAPSKQQAISVTCCGESHACGSAILTPFSAASLRMPSMRHDGIDPEVFQLDTVEGVRLSALATATVPSSASTISFAVIMAAMITINVI